MVHNAYYAYVFVAFWLGSDKEIEPKAMADIMTDVLYKLKLIFARQLIYIIGGRGEILTLGTEYFRITLFGTIFWVAGLTYNLIIRAEGKMGTAAAIIAVSLVVNIIANLILGLMFKNAVSTLNIMYYRIFIMIIPFMSITMMGLSFFPSINRGNIGSMIVMLRQVLLYIPVMLILPRLFGIGYVYIGSFLIDITVTLLTGILLIREFSKLKKFKN